jgi:hypothetical protein
LWFSRWRILSIPLTADATVDDATGAVMRARQEVDAAPPLPCDLRLRAPPSERASVGPAALSIAIAVDAGNEVAWPRGADLLIAVYSDTTDLTVHVRAASFDEGVAQVIAAQIGQSLAAFGASGSKRLAELV